MDVVARCAGIVIVALVVAEVFQDLFHPTGSGTLSDWLGRHLFDLFRHRPAMLPLAGPFTLVLTIITWVALLVLGFALIMYGSVPDGFRTSVMEIPPGTHRFGTALYFSAQTLTTLAFGDISANSPGMRVAAALEGLIGFAVLTASVSSIVLLYPALARMRLLARGVGHIANAEDDLGVTMARAGSAMFHANLARDVTNTRIDLIHFPLIYYFASGNREASLPLALIQLRRMVREGLAPDVEPQVRLAAAALDRAVGDLADVLAVRFLHMDSHDRDALFAAFAHHHLVDAR